VYVSDTNNFRVQVFDKDGKFIRKFGELGDAPGSSPVRRASVWTARGSPT